MPQLSSLHSSFLWGTLSKALEKSRIIKSFCMPEWRWLVISCVRKINWVSQLLLALKPCWQSTKMSCISRCFTMLDTTIFSSTLQQMQVRDTGLQLPARYFSSFLKTGMTLEMQDLWSEVNYINHSANETLNKA